LLKKEEEEEEEEEEEKKIAILREGERGRDRFHRCARTQSMRRILSAPHLLLSLPLWQYLPLYLAINCLRLLRF
jgi:hypothetical protein